MIRQFDFEKMPVVEVVNEIMVDAAKRGASDIHFDPLENEMHIRIRIDGILHNYAVVPSEDLSLRGARKAVLFFPSPFHLKSEFTVSYLPDPAAGVPPASEA